MKIHEYQAKQILARYNVRIPRGEVAYTKEEAREAAERISGTVVVKAQIHAGGRGKGGGVKVTKFADEAADIAGRMIGMNLVTAQTGPEGRRVNKVLIEEGLDIRQELYLGIVIDRQVGKPVFMASASGGMDIEEVAARNPELILKEYVQPGLGLQAFQARRLAFGIGLAPELVSDAVQFMVALYRAFEDTDASLVEINPFLVTGDNKVYALDAKMNFDDNALYRHRDLKELRDLNEEDPLEIEASKFGLNYIKLDGDVACMVNGAGLAMATMDIIKLAGGSPANFLDVGGGASTEQVTEAFKILCADKNVRGILVNIFGGIMKCDVIANGILTAVRQVKVQLPLVVRLEGTNVELGKKILKDSGLAIIPADSMADAAQKIVQAVQRP